MNTSLFRSVRIAIMATLSCSLQALVESPSITMPQATKELAALVQHFGFISHNLVTTTAKQATDNNSFSPEHQAIIQVIAKSYENIIHQVRTHLYSTDAIQQKKAFEIFGNYIVSLCKQCGAKRYYIVSFPATIDSHASVQTYLDLTRKAVTSLESLLTTITPKIPLSTRLAKKLFYNFFSTKVVPNVVSFGLAPYSALVWGISNLITFDEQTQKHPHTNSFYLYEKVPHKKEITYVENPSLSAQIIHGAQPQEVKSTPCYVPYMGNLCNGKRNNNIINKLSKKFSIKEKDITDYIDPQKKSDDPNSVLRYILSSNDPDDDINRDTLGQKFEISKDKLDTFVQHLNRTRASACSSHHPGEDCYHYRGLQSPLKLVRSALWSLRPLSLLGVLYFLGQWAKEAQLPEYEYAIKQQEKQREEDAIATQMRHLKVNHEKTIGFEQIKGQQELLDNEIKMVVDYLKNPLRYKNSASGTRSLLFYGPPGTGKTILARAIAKESGAPLFEITADDILHNDAKQKILATVRLAERVAAQRREKSAIIYIDEIDSITGNRQEGTLDPQRAKALNNLLTIFDGVEKRNPYIHIVIIMATNHYKKLDAALLRPGRIDRKIAIMPPNAHGRQEFFEELLPDEHKHLMPWFVEQTDGYSGAQIVHIVDMAQMIASYAGHINPTEHDYKAALQKYKSEYDKTLTLAQE